MEMSVEWHMEKSLGEQYGVHHCPAPRRPTPYNRRSAMDLQFPIPSILIFA
jgi:hypothetical protein